MNDLGMMLDCWWPGEDGGMSEMGRMIVETSSAVG